MDLPHAMIFKRYPPTKNHSLQAWNAADEHIVHFLTEHPEINRGDLAIYNDRFGYLSCHFAKFEADILIHLASQQNAIRQNLSRNRTGGQPVFWTMPQNKPEKLHGLVLLHIPKSNDLFDFMLSRIFENATEHTLVVCGFMTRHFTPAWLEIAGQYFNRVEQSKAWKKSRLLLLSEKNQTVDPTSFIHKISYKDLDIKQFKGVFSKEKIDMATSFLLENLHVSDTEKTILDWGCGNGIIGLYIQKKFGPKKIVFTDDSLLAVESVRLNDARADIRWQENLAGLKTGDFDLIVTNPPFHFEYETDISVSLAFFEESKYCLAPDGRLVIVANQHVNYKTHLVRHFKSVEILNENQKFVIYQCKDALTL